MKSIVILFSIFLFSQCVNSSVPVVEENEKPVALLPSQLQGYEKAYFASGCFWCVEEIFEAVKGVKEVYSGYSGGSIPNPSYQLVSSGKTNHAEAVEVFYDPKVVSYQTLVNVFFASHDPSTLNSQGPDFGPQYRSMIFYQNEKEKNIVNQTIDELIRKEAFSKITTEVVPFEVFYMAEEYHQDYIHHNPSNPYVRSVSTPRFEAFKQRMPEVLK